MSIKLRRHPLERNKIKGTLSASTSRVPKRSTDHDLTTTSAGSKITTGRKKVVSESSVKSKLSKRVRTMFNSQISSKSIRRLYGDK